MRSPSCFDACITPPYTLMLLKQRSCIGNSHSGIHYRGPSIRRVSCYALLRRCRLPWPRTRCLHQRSLFVGSVSECFATLTTCSVDPALPDLLTRHGPLALCSIQKRRFNITAYRAPWKYVQCCRRVRLPAYPAQYLYGTQLGFEGSYPVGHFGGNQLLGGSMSLSPPC